MNGADLLLSALSEEGVTTLFGNPGSTELPITDALGRRPGARYVLGLHEAVVMGMADGHAQATGRLAAVNVHVQPGLANALSGILNAARARVPLLVTVGQQAQGMLPGGPFLGGDVVGMARPPAKGAWEVRRPEDLAESVAHAVAVATTPPRGPVVLSLPLDVQLAPSSGRPRPGGPAAAPPPPGEDIERAAGLLASARAPALLAGDEVARSGASRELSELALRLGAPVYGEPMPASVPLATDHPLWRGPLPAFADRIAPILEGHDVVLAAGMPVFRLFGWSPGPAVPAETALLHLDVDPEEVGRSHPPAVGMVGDVGAGLAGILARLGDPSPGAHARRDREIARTADARRRARARVALAGGGPRIGPASLVRAVAAALGPRDLLVDEALTAGRGLRAVVSRRTSSTWMAHRGSALGWGLPAAVGAGIADPGRRVMAVQGDGGLLFGVSALWTAAREGVGPALVVADNGGYEILRAGLEGLTGRPEGEWPGLSLRGPDLDLAAICRGFGASAARVEAAADLPEAMSDLWRRASEGPAVLVAAVEGRTDPVGGAVDPVAARVPPRPEPPLRRTPPTPPPAGAGPRPR